MTLGLRVPTEAPDDLVAYEKTSARPALGGEYDEWLALDPRSAEATRFRIVQPADGSTFLRFDSDPDPQRLGFETAGPASHAVEWILNGKHIGTTSQDKPLFWPLYSGSYTLVAHSGDLSDAVTFTVRAATHDDLPRGFVVRAPAAERL